MRLEAKTSGDVLDRMVAADVAAVRIGGDQVAELLVQPDNSALRLNGCGMAIVNAPYRIDEAIARVLDALVPLLEQGRKTGSKRMEWLARE